MEALSFDDNIAKVIRYVMFMFWSEFQHLSQQVSQFYKKLLTVCIYLLLNYRYRKIASSNTSCLEAHVGIYRLLMKVILNAYLL